MHQIHPAVAADWKKIITAALIGVAVAVVVLFAGEPSSAGQAVAAGGILLSIVVAVSCYGPAGAAILLVICASLTFAIENLGIATGIPFGRYHFVVGANLPHIGAVPLVVGPLYFGVGFLAWIIAATLLGEADLHLDRDRNVMALPVIAAFVMVQWDLVMDPANSTLHRAWIWHDGGGYFGVPMSNFAGWYLTVWAVFQSWALAIRRWPNLFARSPTSDVRLTAILLYAAIGLSQIVPYLTGANSVVVDARGQTWRASDIREAAVTIMALTMVPTSILALFVQLRRRTT